jgi:hypothetical protein
VLVGPLTHSSAQVELLFTKQDDFGATNDWTGDQSLQQHHSFSQKVRNRIAATKRSSTALHSSVVQEFGPVKIHRGGNVSNTREPLFEKMWKSTSLPQMSPVPGRKVVIKMEVDAPNTLNLSQPVEGAEQDCCNEKVVDGFA